MKSLHFILLLIALTISLSTCQTIILTPILPPTAFENEFYHLRFRVRGLVGTKFQFSNLPDFFTASSSGLISGVPTSQGLFPIEVHYSAENYTNSEEVIIEVRRGTKLINFQEPKTGEDIEGQQSSQSEEPSQSQVSANELKPKAEYFYTYAEKDQLNIDLNIRNGMSPYTFNPIYLPPQMSFNPKTGSIYGSFTFTGIYVAGLTVLDALGRQIQVLIKFVITDSSQQNTAEFIFYRRSLIYLNFGTLKSIEDRMVVNNVSTTQNEESNGLNQNGNGGGAISLPTEQPKSEENMSAAESETQSAEQTQSSEPIIPQRIHESTQNQEEAFEEIVSTDQLLGQNITIEDNMAQIEQKRSQIQEELTQAEDTLQICYQNVETARTTVQNLHQAYDQQNSHVENLKDQLESLKTQSERLKIDVGFKQDSMAVDQRLKDLAETEHKRAQHSYDNVNHALNGSKFNIQDNQASISTLESEIEELKRQLDSLYGSLDEAMQQKQALRKRKAETTEQIEQGYEIFQQVQQKFQIFGGCQNYEFYPKSTGVGRVSRVMAGFYLLTNEEFITFGDCSEHQFAEPGDYIAWNGYIKGGLTSALSIQVIKMQ